jgi:MFS family permease
MTIGLFGTMLLSGWFVGSFFIVRLGDIYGRKTILVPCTVISIITLLLIAIGNNLIALKALIFVFGVMAAPRYSLSYVYANELTTAKHESLYSMISMVLDSSALIILGIYFTFIKDLKPLFIALVIL